MLNFSKDKAIRPKTCLTHGLLPRNFDKDQLPTAKQPFSTFQDQHWSHSLELLLPEELYDATWTKILENIGTYNYEKVIMPLSALLEGEFFLFNIKNGGNVSMLSEGRPGVDSLYSMRKGVLRLELPKDRYERAGLVGKPIADGGSKHIKTRYVVEIDFLQKHMNAGHKGFERIRTAFNSTLNESVTWLYFDHERERGIQNHCQPVNDHRPFHKVASPEICHYKDVYIPPLSAPVDNANLDHDESLDLLEWIGMATVASPRLSSEDSIDPYLSRYQIPNRELTKTGSIVSVRWHGFLVGEWTRRLFIECLSATNTHYNSWLAVTVSSFRTEAVNSNNGFTLLCLPDRDEYKDRIDKEEDAMDTGEPDQKPHKPQREYILWEMASSINDK